jgi:hypothetical protein
MPVEFGIFGSRNSSKLLDRSQANFPIPDAGPIHHRSCQNLAMEFAMKFRSALFSATIVIAPVGLCHAAAA